MNLLRFNKFYFFIVAVSAFFLFSQVWAHTPLNGIDEIHSLDTAFNIENPTKSWTLYRELHNEADYYKLQLNSGEQLRVSLYVKDLKENFSPELVIMGEDFVSQNIFPDNLEKPQGYEALIFESETPQEREYEPFTPTSYYYLIDVDLTLNQTGDYFMAIFEPNSVEGNYGLAVGYKEEYTLTEWIMVPFDVVSIHEWEGQTIIEILTPMILTLVIGFAVMVWKGLLKFKILQILGAIGGLLYVGSAMMILHQMIIAILGATFTYVALFTLIFVAIPLILGLFIIKKAANFDKKLSLKNRIIFVTLALAGLFSWSGFIIGPILVAICGLLPIRILK